jgi:hypothetical protein
LAIDYNDGTWTKSRWTAADFNDGTWKKLGCDCCGTVTVPCCPAFPISRNLTLTISITGGSCGGGLLPVSIPLTWDGTNWTSEHFQ